MLKAFLSTRTALRASLLAAVAAAASLAATSSAPAANPTLTVPTGFSISLFASPPSGHLDP